MLYKKSNLEQFIDLLGRRCRDRVTEIEGVITHVGFDLYGCIQAIVHPGKSEPTKAAETIWMDINRLEIMPGEKVMDTPKFQDATPKSIGVGFAEQKPVGNGPGEKPSFSKQ